MLKISFVVLLIAAAPAVARPSNPDKGPVDPNKQVCRTADVIGSRLQTKKTCMTRGQWEQYEREQRTTVERVQAFKPNNGN